MGVAAVFGAIGATEAAIADSPNAPGWVKSVGTALHPVNEFVGKVGAPFDVTGEIGTEFGTMTGSHLAGYVAGAATNGGVYAATGILGGTPAVVALAGTSAIRHALDAAGQSDMVVGRENAMEILAGRGVNGSSESNGRATDFGSFGHDLAIEFQAETADPGAASHAASKFMDLYEAQRQSDWDLGRENSLALHSPTGWGAADENARAAMLDLKDVVLHPGDGGAIFFPNGKSYEWQGSSETTGERHSEVISDTSEVTTDVAAADPAPLEQPAERVAEAEQVAPADPATETV
jgi:hypothetical protein